MKKNLLLASVLVLCAVSFTGFSQSGSVVISQTVPTSVNVCDSAQFIIKIQNITGNTLTGLLLNVAMPGGVTYKGSLSSLPAVPPVLESDISNLQDPVFSIPAIAAFNSIFILFYADVDCGILNFQQQGNAISNTAVVTYTDLTTDQDISSTYNVNAPSLVITTFTNQTFTGPVGTTFTRSITIQNSGTGALSSFTFTDVHGVQIDILGVAPGVLSGNATNDTVTVSGTDFSGIGNGNNFFENGESITLIETIQIIACVQPGVPSNISVYWGCGNQAACQTATTTANVIETPVGTPDLVITPTESFETCLDPGIARIQSLQIVNIGAGSANNIAMDIYQGSFTVPNPGYKTRIDETSFTFQTGINGTATAIVADSFHLNNPFSCLGTNPAYRVYLRIPTVINPITDTVYLKWDSYTCCQVLGCDSSFLTAVAPWEFQGRYTDACDSNTTYDIFPTSGGSIWGRYLNTSMTPEDMPTDISDGATVTFEHSATNWQNELDAAPGAYYQVEITVPPCFTLGVGPDPIRFIYNPNGTLWLPTSPLTITGNVVTAIFATPDPFGVNGLSQASLLFDLTADCSSCPDSLKTGQNVSVNIKYNADPSCIKPCLLKVYCNANPVNLHCAGNCPDGGMIALSYKMERTSYGQPDNNNDGLPEIGSVDLNVIKNRRAMFGDTLTGSFKGVIDTTLAHLFFTNAYATASINNLGTYITFIDASVTIFDASTSTVYNCNNVPPLSAAPNGSSYDSDFDISPLYLNTNGCAIPGGFVFEHGDSVFLNHRYKVTGNTGGPVVSSNSTTSFYASDIPNPPPNPIPANQFSCDNFSGNYLSLYGFYFTSDTVETYVTKSCNTPTIRNTNYMSIGPCCQNYGSNKFPFEYRPWANIDTIKVTLPAGYGYVSSTVTGSGQTLTNITPLNPLSNPLVFDMNALYSGGTWPDYSFDGYANTIQVQLNPSCGVTNSTLNPILYEEVHKKQPFIGGGDSTVPFTDFIAFTSPQITLQSTLQTVNGINSIESWEITICNTSNNSNAFNTWISLVSPNGNITPIDVTDVTTSTIIPPTGGIYKLGNRPFNTCNKYKIRFTYNACSLDSLIVNAGFNCIGYPDSLSAYPCAPLTHPLFVDPKPAGLQMLLSGPSSDTTDLCDTIGYEVVLNSILLSSVYNIVLSATIPAGMTVEPGTSEVLYPETPVVWVPFSDPVANQWYLSDSLAQLAVNGLPGVNSPSDDQIKIRFKVRTDCNFISGSTVPFTAISTNICNQALPTQFSTSGPLYIQGVEQLNITTMAVSIDPIRPCGAPSLVKVSVLNVGPNVTSGSEHFNFPVSTGAAYFSGSFIGTHNPPPIGTPLFATVNGESYLDWQFPVGVQPLDSVTFTFLITMDPDSTNCSSILFPVKTTGSFNATCIADGSICVIKAITSAADINVPVSKPCLSVSALTASSLPAGTGENITLDYTVFNSCGDKAAGQPVIVNFYFDTDNDGVYSTGDALIGSDTSSNLMLSNTASSYTNISFFSSTVASCSILAVIDTSENSCTCANSEIAVSLPLLNAGVDSAFCSGDSLIIGLVSTAGYTYSWSPVNGLSNLNASSTSLTLTNNTLSPLVQNYILTTDRGGCISDDTVQITVNPIPTVTATPATQTLCSGDNTSIALSSSVSGVTFSWIVNQTGVTGAVAGSGPAITQTLTTIGSVAGSVIYTITPSADSCPGPSFDVTITVNPVNSASFNYSSGTYCQSGNNQTPTITGSIGGVFSSLPAGLSINASTGTIDLSASALGTYTVTYTTADICPNTSTVNVTITNITPSAVFSYPNSPFCPNGINPFPVFGPGASAGIFSATPAGLVFVNANTGQIDLTLSTPGTYTVINTIPASGSCLAATATSPVSIALDDASFVYTSATYCISGANPTPTITGLPGGTFSAIPSGLSINPSSGIIDLANSTVGAYTLSYTTNGNCPNTSSILMTMDSITPSAIFSYSDSLICQNGNNPVPVYISNASAGFYSAVPAGLVFVNLNTGEIDILLSVPGTYTVTNTIPVSGTCAAVSDITVITISPADDASFTYPSGTYCTSGINPSPTITGLPGGTFSAVPAGLSINTVTGTIDLATSAIGTYTITYATNDSCPNTSSITMTIGNTTPSAAFSYSGLTFCQNGSNPIPIFASGASGGVFSATPSGLVFVNPATGEINLSLSVPGTYTVVNTIPASGSCLAATSTTTVTISLDDASFTYTSATYCQSGANPTPVITGLPGGTFSASPAGLSINSSTGTIDLATSALGSYTLNYTTNGTCPATSFITMTIGNTTPSSLFTYSAASFCQYGFDPLPVFSPGASAGLFSAAPSGLVFTHVNTGQIDLSASTPGTYTVTNTIPVSGTCLSTLAVTMVTIGPTDDASFNYSSGTYCQSGTNQTPVISGLAGGTFTSSPSGLSVDPATGTIDLGTSALGSYTVTYTTNGLCSNANSISITIGNTTPPANFSYSGSSFCQSGNNPFPVFAPGASAGTFSAVPAGLVFVNLNTGQINLSASLSGTYTVTNTIPTSGSCLATSAITTFTISTDDASFNYSSGTYCQSGTNPVPIVSGLAGGVFSTSSSGLVINASTGEIELTTSILGTYVVTYSTNGPCPASGSILINISNVTPSADFSYVGSPFCQNTPNPSPVPGSNFGIFSATPSGLVFVNLNTGEINLSQSIPGTYTVTNTIPASGTCQEASATAIVIITPAEDASFVYSSATYCQSGANPTPVIIGVPGGIFSASPAGLSINPTTGTIDLASSLLNIYTLNYITNGTCPNISSITMTITNVTPTADFSYDGSPFCQYGTNPFPIFNQGASAGIFSAIPAGLAFVHVNTGQLDLGLSTPGTYTVSNNIPVSGTCNAANATYTITIEAAPIITVTVASQTVCNGDSVSIVLSSSIPGTTFAWTVNQTGVTGAAAGSGTDISQLLTLSGTNQGSAVYTITSIANGCIGLPIVLPVIISPLSVLDTTSAIITPANCDDTTGSILGIVVASGQGPFQYQWSDQGGSVIGNNADLINTGPGDYTLTVTDANGCSSSSGLYTITSTSVIVAAFSADPITGETPLTVNFTNNSSNASNYLWTFGTGDTSTAVDPTYIYLPLGNFTVCLMADNGGNCIDTACSTIDIFVNSVFVTPNVFSPNGDGVNDMFTLQTKGLKTLEVEIFNRWGQKIYEWHTVSGGWDGRSSSGVLCSEGTYFFMINALGFDGKKYFEKGGFSLVH